MLCNKPGVCSRRSSQDILCPALQRVQHGATISNKVSKTQKQHESHTTHNTTDRLTVHSSERQTEGSRSHHTTGPDSPYPHHTTVHTKVPHNRSTLLHSPQLMLSPRCQTFHLLTASSHSTLELFIIICNTVYSKGTY